MTVEWDSSKFEDLSPEGREQLVATAQQIAADANRSSGGHYYAARLNRDGKSVSIFRGSKKSFLVEFGTRAIRGGRHLKKALDRHRVK